MVVPCFLCCLRKTDKLVGVVGVFAHFGQDDLWDFLVLDGAAFSRRSPLWGDTSPCGSGGLLLFCLVGME